MLLLFAYVLWVAFVFAMAWAIIPPLFGHLKRLTDELFGRPRQFTITPHEETEWGTMFAIRDPKGQIVGLDTYTVARQRCAAFNRGEAPPSAR